MTQIKKQLREDRTELTWHTQKRAPSPGTPQPLAQLAPPAGLTELLGSHFSHHCRSHRGAWPGHCEPWVQVPSCPAPWTGTHVPYLPRGQDFSSREAVSASSPVPRAECRPGARLGWRPGGRGKGWGWPPAAPSLCPGTKRWAQCHSGYQRPLDTEAGEDKSGGRETRRRKSIR